MARLETLSASALSLYISCSLKFRFQYVDRLPRLFRSSNQVFGTAMHAALEWLHKELRNLRKPPLDEILRVFEADWHAQLVDGDIRFEDDDPAALVVKGKQLLSRYYAEAIPVSGVKAAELAFQLPLVNPETGEVLPAPVRGYIDLVEADGTVTEFKNSARTMPVTDLPDNVQLTTYAWAYDTLFGKPPKDVKLVNLVRTKTPKIETHLTGREPKDYVRLFHLGKEVLHAAEQDVYLPNRGCWMCKSCEYEQDCREWTGNR